MSDRVRDTRRRRSPKRAPTATTTQSKEQQSRPIRRSHFRLSLSVVAFVLLVLANLGQHRWHPPLSLCEEQAVKDYGTVSWRDKFDPSRGLRRWWWVAPGRSLLV